MWPFRWWVALLASGGLLIVLLIPALNNAREQARRANCLGNLKCCTLAFAMYADNYQDRCPVDKGVTLVGCFMLTSSTAGSPKIWLCPSDHRRGVGYAKDFTTLTEFNISYSYVPNLMWGGGTNVILWLDRIYTTERGDKWPHNGNHGNTGGNVAFTDGHVGFFKELPENLRDKDGQPVVLSP